MFAASSQLYLAPLCPRNSPHSYANRAASSQPLSLLFPPPPPSILCTLSWFPELCYFNLASSPPRLLQQIPAATMKEIFCSGSMHRRAWNHSRAAYVKSKITLGFFFLPFKVSVQSLEQSRRLVFFIISHSLRSFLKNVSRLKLWLKRAYVH